MKQYEKRLKLKDLAVLLIAVTCITVVAATIAMVIADYCLGG